jgi:hypothetical protein
MDAVFAAMSIPSDGLVRDSVRELSTLSLVFKGPQATLLPIVIFWFEFD